MNKTVMGKKDALSLKKRYLLWLYKTTKEALDRMERKFTQVEIDRFLIAEIERLDPAGKASRNIEEFMRYVENKEREGQGLKYSGRELSPEYYFLALKLKAVEKAIRKFLGGRALKEIKALYEDEMMQRILKSTEH